MIKIWVKYFLSFCILLLNGFNSVYANSYENTLLENSTHIQTILEINKQPPNHFSGRSAELNNSYTSILFEVEEKEEKEKVSSKKTAKTIPSSHFQKISIKEIHQSISLPSYLPFNFYSNTRFLKIQVFRI